MQAPETGGQSHFSVVQFDEQLRWLSRTKAMRPVCSESNLDNFMHSAVNDVVLMIIKALCDDPDARH